MRIKLFIFLFICCHPVFMYGQRIEVTKLYDIVHTVYYKNNKYYISLQTSYRKDDNITLTLGNKNESIELLNKLKVVINEGSHLTIYNDRREKIFIRTEGYIGVNILLITCENRFGVSTLKLHDLEKAILKISEFE